MSATLTASGSTTARRSTRPKRSSDSKTARSSPTDSHRGNSQSLGSDGALDGKSTNPHASIATISPSDFQAWRHPDEFSYVINHDLSQNMLIEYFRRKVFTIPPRELNSTIPLFQVTFQDGTAIALPRGYRVPLMFVTKFQWDTLSLVLTGENPRKEWEDYKFDILYLSRLCQNLFVQAEEAKQQALAKGAKGIDRFWRCATFDRVLTRFYHRWFISREWSLRKFWEEFGEDEYKSDVLKHGWYFSTLLLKNKSTCIVV